jgi:pimeloyl-ACP methyl ester carboxylesterase
MAEQAAIGQDVIDLADALKLPKFAVGGFDWGGRAACVAAALNPNRVSAALLIGGYSIQNLSAPIWAMSPEAAEHSWYQWYFHTEQGRVGLQKNRKALCRYMWQTWSPTWRFSDALYEKTAASFENPDFADCVIHSYRHRNNNAPGESRLPQASRRARWTLTNVYSTIEHFYENCCFAVGVNLPVFQYGGHLIAFGGDHQLR